MRVITHTLRGEERPIYIPGPGDSLEPFERFIAATPIIGLDTETSGLDTYSPTHRLRLAQFGSESEAWVIRWDLFPEAVREALQAARAFVCHNAAYDLQVLDRHGAASLDSLVPRTVDTRILAHLLDPRMRHEGGTGLRLKELAEVYVDPSAPDTENGLTAEFRRLGMTKATGWALIPYDNELYLRYAGLDVLLVSGLYPELITLIVGLDLGDLSEFEHKLAANLSAMQRRGILLDTAYIDQLADTLTREEEHYRAVADSFGVDSVNSTAKVSAALLGMGETLKEKTPSGAWKVDKAVLHPLADLNGDWERLEVREPNPLAEAVLHATRASKWRKSYLEAFHRLKDDNNRLHASINGLQARTGRMSVSSPPLQQLPSGDSTIRRALVADPGHLMIAADYKQVEMRVLAALCEDEMLVEAILSGVDLHDFTAEKVFGPDFTKGHRRIAKSIGFGKVYGGGKATISRQTGAPMDQVAEAINAYDRTFPGIKRYANRLQRAAQFGKYEVITPAGRILPLDRDRLYSATNYVVQSTARDILAQAIVDCFNEGLGDYLLLPVHDELLGQAPAADAEEVILEIARVMDGVFRGIPILSDPEVVGTSWGGN